MWVHSHSHNHMCGEWMEWFAGGGQQFQEAGINSSKKLEQTVPRSWNEQFQETGMNSSKKLEWIVEQFQSCGTVRLKLWFQWWSRLSTTLEWTVPGTWNEQFQRPGMNSSTTLEWTVPNSRKSTSKLPEVHFQTLGSPPPNSRKNSKEGNTI